MLRGHPNAVGNICARTSARYINRAPQRGKYVTWVAIITLGTLAVDIGGDC